MRQILLMMLFAAVLAACGGETKQEEAAAEPQRDENYSNGLALVAKSDCLTCHKVDEKMTGPSYKEIAARYEATDANIQMLAGKIIQGGKGNWGEIMMTPHTNLSQEDAETMVKYILQLK